MANPQAENGFVRIATAIMDRLCKMRIPGEARQVLDFIIRKTWGFQKKSDIIALSQFVAGTGIRKQAIIRARVTLLQMNLIVTEKGNALGLSYSFQKDYDLWKPLPKKRTYPKKRTPVPQKEYNRTPKRDPQKIIDTLTKDKKTPAVKKPPERVTTDFQLACEHFMRAYQNEVGAPYGFHGKTVELKLADGTVQVIYAGGEDSGKMKQLFSRKWTLPQIKTLIDTMFASTDEFYRKGGGCTIGVLLANDNKLVQELRRKVDGTNDMSELQVKNAATMAKVLQEMECQATPKLSQE